MPFIGGSNASARHFAEFIPDVTLVVQNNTTYTDIVEVFTDDTGEEPSWYTAYSEEQAALIWALKPSIIIIDGSIRTFADWGEGPDYNPPIDVDNTVIYLQTLFNPGLVINDYEPDESTIAFDDTGEEPSWYTPQDEYLAASIWTQALSILVIDMPVRSFGDVGDTGDYDPYNDEAGIITLITGFSPALVILDYSPDPWNDDDTSDSSEYDFRDDSTILFTVYTELFVFNDYSPLELEQLTDDTGEEPSWYTALDGDPVLNFIIYTELFVENDYAEFEVIEDTEGDFYPDFGIDLSWYFSPQTLLIFNDYVPLEGETLIEDSEGDYYPDFSIDLSFFLPIVTENFVFNDYSEFEVIEDTEGDIYPDFGIDLSWYLSPQTLLIFNDYAPLDNEELIEDSEGDYYPDFSVDLSFFLPIVTENFIFNDYSPLELEQLVDDSGDEPAWYTALDDDPVLNFIIYTELFVENDYTPSDNEELIEDSEGDFYPDFSIDLSWYLSPQTLLIFNDYPDLWAEDDSSDEQAWYPAFADDSAILFAQQLTDAFRLNDYSPDPWVDDDTSDNGEYDPLYDNIEAWYSTFFLLVENPVIDYLEMYSDDSSDSGEYDLPFEELLQWFIPPLAVSYLVFNDYVPWELEQLTEESEGDYYPDFSTDITWFLPIVTENFIFNDYSPDPWADDDTSDGGEYDPLYDNVESWYSTLSPLIIENPFIDYLELYTDDSSDSGEYDLPFEELLQWFIPPTAVVYLVFNEYIPLELEELTEESEGDYYPDFSIDLSFFLPIVTENFIFNDYSPLELEQLTEDEGSDQAWYSPQEEALSWFITAVPALVYLIFNEYVPLDTDQLIEDTGEGDFYPDFSIDLSWYFAPSTLLIFNDYVPWETETLLEESDGDYYPDFSIDLSFFLPIVTENFVFNDYVPLDNDELTEESEGDYYPDFSIDLSFFLPIVTELFVFNDYSPLELDQLTEDLGDGTWYDPFWDDSAILFAQGLFPVNAFEFEWRAIDTPEMEQEDQGDEDTWYGSFGSIDWIVTFFVPPIPIENLIGADQQSSFATPDPFLQDDEGDDTFYDPIYDADEVTFFLIGIATVNLVFLDYSPDDFDSHDENIGFQSSTSSYAIAFGANENFIFNDYTPLDNEELMEESEGDYYPDTSTDLSFFLPIVTENFIFNDYSPLEAETLIEDSEGDYYPDFSIDISWVFSTPASGPIVIIDYSPDDFDSYDESIGFTSPASYSLIFGVNENFIFNDYTPTDSEELSEESEGDYYPDFSIDVSWYLAPSQFLVIVNDYSPDDLDAYDETIGFQSSISTYLVIFGANENFIFNDYTPSDNEELMEESEGDYYPDFSIDLSWYFSAPPAQFVFIDYAGFEAEESEGDYYPPIETDGVLITHTIVTVLFVENDYTPLELEQLTEESEGDYYPDFSVDMTWYIVQPSYPARLVFNDYSPLDFDSYIEDDGSEESWHHGLFYLGITINYTEYMILYFPVYATIALYTPLTETSPGTEQQVLVLYFPLQGTSSGGNLVGTS